MDGRGWRRPLAAARARSRPRAPGKSRWDSSGGWNSHSQLLNNACMSSDSISCSDLGLKPTMEGENPIYKSAVTTVVNPKYEGK